MDTTRAPAMSKSFRLTAIPVRARKFDLKLRLAAEANLPFFVVAYDEARRIEADDELTVTHSVVGRALARLHLQEAIEERYEAQRDWIESLHPDMRNEVLQDLVSDTAMELSFEWDPFQRAASRASWEAHRIAAYWSMRQEHLSDPPLPDGDPWTDAEVFAARVEVMLSARKVGSRATIVAKDGRETVVEAWVRNIDGVHAAGSRRISQSY